MSTARARARRSTSISGVLLAAVALGCGGEVAGPSAPTPRGAAAYSGVRIEERGDLGVAAGGAVVPSSGGAPVELATLWREGDLVLVFYRGYW